MARKNIGQTLIEAAACGLTAYLIGRAATALYQQSTPEERRRWDSERVMHHREVGCLAAALGLLTESPNMLTAGLGLIASDAQDVDQWFK